MVSDSALWRVAFIAQFPPAEKMNRLGPRRLGAVFVLPVALMSARQFSGTKAGCERRREC
ncbi:MAG: hypothetical protein DU429_05385 [Candidatus Tokpelaia sp.]|nr:MAG: hypothetical protein DU429_05385 [Candidatus Tokpelaia sp.]